MATSIPSANAPAAHSTDQLIGQRLDEARRALWFGELTRTALRAVIACFVVTLAWIVIDQWIYSPGLMVRTLCFLTAGATLIWYCVARLWPVLTSKVTDEYAAWALEQEQPDFRQQLTSYVTLKDQQSGFRARVVKVIGARAASLLRINESLPAEAVGTFSWWLVTIAAFFILALYCVLTPKSPLVSAQRLFLPLATVEPAKRVTILDVQPGSVQVLAGRTVEFSAEVAGLYSDESVQCVWASDGPVRELPMDVDPDSGRYLAALSLDPSMSGHIEYQITAGDAKSGPYRLDIENLPVVAVRKIQIRPPDYTGHRARTTSSPSISVIDGTMVQLSAVSSRPVVKAELQFNIKAVGSDQQPSAARIPMQIADDGKTLQVETVLHAVANHSRATQPVNYRIKVWDQQGQSNPQPIVYPIEVIADLSPEVAIVLPKRSPIKLPVNGQQTIEVHAMDADFQLSTLQLKISDGIGELKSPLIWINEDGFSGRGNQIAEFRFRPQDFGLKAGEIVQVIATAADNRFLPDDPFGGPNQAVTDPLEIQIIAAEQNLPEEPQENDGLSKPDQQPPSDVDQQQDQEQQGEDGESGNKGQSGDKGQSGQNGQSGENGQSGQNNPSGDDAQMNQGQSQDQDQPADENQQDGQDSESQTGEGQQGDQGEQGDQNQQDQGQSGDQGQQGDNDQQGDSNQQGDTGQQGNTGQQGDSGQQNGQGGADSGNSSMQDQPAGQQGDSSTQSGGGESSAGQDSPPSGDQPSADEGNAGGQDQNQTAGQDSTGQDSTGQDPSTGNQSGDGITDPQDAPPNSGDQANRQPPSGQGQSSPDQQQPVQDDADAFERIKDYIEQQKNPNQQGQNQSQQQKGQGQQGSASDQSGDSTQQPDQTNGSESGGDQKSGDAGKGESDPSQMTDPGQENKRPDEVGTGQQSETTDKPQGSGDNEAQGSRDNEAQGSGDNEAQGSEAAPMNEQGDQANNQNGDQNADSGSTSDAQDQSQGSGQPSNHQDPPQQPSATDKPSGDDRSANTGDQQTKDPKTDADQTGTQGQDDSETGGQNEQAGSQANDDSSTDPQGQQDQNSGGQSDQPMNDANRDQNSGHDDGQSEMSDRQGDSENSSDPQTGQGEGQQDQTGQSGQDQNPSQDNQNSGEQNSGEQNSGQPSNPRQKPGQQEGDDPNSSDQPGEQPSQEQSQEQSQEGNNGRPDSNGTGSQPAQQTVPPPPPDLEYTKKATDMVLDYLKEPRDQFDPELLNDLGWTEQDMRRFQQRWERVRQLDQPGADASDQQSFGDALRSLGLKPGRNAAKSNGLGTDGLRHLNDARTRRPPPPALRDAFEAFQRRQ